MVFSILSEEDVGVGSIFRGRTKKKEKKQGSGFMNAVRGREK